MTTLMQASQQWASRPADERYASLYAMREYMTRRRERSRATVESTRGPEPLPGSDQAVAAGRAAAP